MSSSVPYDRSSFEWKSVTDKADGGKLNASLPRKRRLDTESKSKANSFRLFAKRRFFLSPFLTTNVKSVPFYASTPDLFHEHVGCSSSDATLTKFSVINRVREWEQIGNGSKVDLGNDDKKLKLVKSPIKSNGTIIRSEILLKTAEKVEQNFVPVVGVSNPLYEKIEDVDCGLSKQKPLSQTQSYVNQLQCSDKESSEYLTRLVPCLDLSTRDGDAIADNVPGSNTKEGKTRKPAERRESGRFQSAARILRSLAKGRDDDGAPVNRSKSNAPLDRTNPHYHSEGKGTNKSNSHKDAPKTHKERSRSFCDKPDAKKRYSKQEENRLLRKEAKAKLEFRLNSSRNSSASLNLSTTSRTDDVLTPPQERDELSLNPSFNYDSVLSPKEGIECVSIIPEESLEETISFDRTKEKKSGRKLTKDSGYETSPYSEGDYANLDLNPSDLDAKLKDIQSDSKGQDLSNNERVNSNSEEKLSVDSGPLIPDQVCASNADDFSNNDIETSIEKSSPKVELKRFSSADSLNTFAESLLVTPCLADSPVNSSLLPARSTPVLCHYALAPQAITKQSDISDSPKLNGSLHSSKSTPNLEETEDGTMVTKKFSMYSYLEGSKGTADANNSSSSRDPYWELPLEDPFNPSDYAHHLRSSSYQILHSRQLSSGSYHSRQPSNNSNYSESEDDIASLSSISHLDRSRCFSYDNLGKESSGRPIPWNVSEPDLSLPLQPKELNVPPPLRPSPKTSIARKLSTSPPPPPVRDASSLKYIRYGPGHEKYPSWPVQAGVLQLSLNNNLNATGLPESTTPYLTPPQGSHRSHSWTEQSEYTKDNSGGYARPSHKRQTNSQLSSVGMKGEKNSQEFFQPQQADELLRMPNYSLLDSYIQQSKYYPLYDREGRAIDDKDYSIPSPPERDPGMGEANLSQVTAAQLEEHARRCNFALGDLPIGDFPQITPLLDQLRQESYTWDGSSERDSGRGESESFTDSRYSNGRESVTTVVTNSSSASSSETLKWHGSLSDISVMSGHSKDPRGDHNIVHSSRVPAPQRHNSESVLYYGRSKPLCHNNTRLSRDGSRNARDFDNAYPRPFRDSKWTREVERNNEVNNLKKFPSYSYTQPLSQISEAPLAESRESFHVHGKGFVGVSSDPRKPPSVADRVNELERQSRTSRTDKNSRWPRDSSEPRNVRRRLEELQSMSLNHEASFLSEFGKNNSENFSDSNEFQKSSVVSTMSPPSIVRCKSMGSPSNKILDEAGEYLSTSYTYLDPDKKCKVPDATLKNIQKQALLSFYERRTRQSMNGSGSSSSSLHSNSGVGAGNFDVPNRGIVPGKGMARLGRVPDPESSPTLNSRRRSASGNQEEKNADELHLEVPPQLPAKPQQSNLASVNAFNKSSSPENHLKNDKNYCAILDTENRSPRVCHDASLQDNCATSKLHPLPPSTHCPEDSLIIETPPDRPPKKPNLRSLFHCPDSIEPKKSSAKPYFYRKAPAPDPPQTVEPPLKSSRSSTPELPPPPPPPLAEEEEVSVPDEPLPPPPQVEDEAVSLRECSSPTDSVLNKESYHKDSYMANRRDWKTGYEGKYRRTHSPCASDRNMFNALQNSPNLPLPKKPILHMKSNGNLRSAVSTSSLMQRPPSPLDNESLHSSSNENSLNNNNEVFSVNRNNEWSSHVRQVSTTVNFTTEELRAFEARKKHKDFMPLTEYLCDSETHLARPLMRAVSLGETLHHCESSYKSSEEDLQQEIQSEIEKNPPETSSLDCSIESENLLSSPTRLSHDGPITAHPATVTEEYSNPVSPVSILSDTVRNSQVTFVSSPSPDSVQSSPMNLAQHSTLVSSLSTPNISICSENKSTYHRSLSGTCPSMTSDLEPQNENIVVLGYGRTPNSVEVSCNELSQEFIKQNHIDSKLMTLLAPDSGYKSAGTYMEGVFALELRRDLLCHSHAQHPDLKITLSDPSQDTKFEQTETSSNKDPLSADSAYFTTSESKAKLLSAFREKQQVPSSTPLESQFLTEKKEKLIESITKKLDILRLEELAIKEEISLNTQLGIDVSAKVESRAKKAEFEKYKLHVEEIDKITSLLLGLSGRLARVENALLTEENNDHKTLSAKKAKLEEQLEEAKKLKENIDRRAVQVSVNVTKYLTTDEYADYDHFIKMKAKLLMDTKEIHDKIHLGQEQLDALRKPSL